MSKDLEYCNWSFNEFVDKGKWLVKRDCETEPIMSTLSSVPEERAITMFAGVDVKKLTSQDRQAINNYINQQIKSVLDELEGEVIGGDESSGIFPEIGESSTIRDNLRAEQRDAIQKIRSRYE